MTTKFGSWLMAGGALLCFVGLCFLPAAFGADPERAMLGGGMVVIAMGVLLISGGFYVKARALGTAAPATVPVTPKRSRTKSICDQCAVEEPVIQCRVHQLHLCADCLTKHYDFRSCAYVPSTRRANLKAGAAAYSKASSG